MDEAPYDSKAIANMFLELAAQVREPVTPMKMQKLVYYAHGWYAGYTGRPLISEDLEAWQYGPVIPTLYIEFAPFGARPITSKAKEWGWGDNEVPLPANDSVRQFLGTIWESYGKYSGFYLSELTHAAGAPWDTVRKNTDGTQKVRIPFSVIHDYFRTLVERTRQKRKENA